MIRSLEGQTILITGAAVRIGRSLAIAAAQHGANIVIHYGKSRSDAEETLAEVEKAGVKGILIQADLNIYDQVTSIIPNAMQFGPIDAVVNSASIFEPLHWYDTSLSDWDRHMNINLTAPFLISKGFAQTLLPDRSGKIINLLDWRAERPGSDHFPYSISKAGLSALTKSLAQALAPQITVNAMALGAILPPSSGNVVDDLLNDVPTNRWGTLDEVNQAFLFLLTGPAYITGEVLHIDGGRHFNLGNEIMDQVFITDLIARGIIGINDWEREHPQEIRINIIIYTDLRDGGESDDINHSVNYRTVAKKVLKHAETAKRLTVEALAADITKICLNEIGVLKVRVRIEKPGAVRFSHSVGVEIERSIQDFIRN